MKEIILTVQIYDKPHNILLSFTKEQKIYIGKEVHICIHACIYAEYF